MSANITINPNQTTTAAGTFDVSSVGLIQGMAYPDPSTRFRLRGGILATTETLPMWGGVALTEDVPGASGGPSGTLGPIVKRATAVTGGSTPITAFSVFDQAYGMINSPQSPVPLAGSGAQVMSYRLGSLARIAVACDPTLVDLQGGAVTQQVSWDFNNQRLQPYDASTGTVSVNSASWASNLYTLNVTTSSLIWTPVAGDYLNVSGATNSGTGGNSAVNGDFVVVSTSVSGSNTLINLSLPAASGVIGTIAGSILLNLGTGALPVDVLDVQTTNCMTVNYNPATGFATWNYNDCCAVIQI